MGRQSRILRLFRAAGDGGEGKRQPSIFLIVLIMTLVAAGVAYLASRFYQDITSAIGTTVQEDVVDTSIVEDRAEELAAEVRHMRHVRIHAEKLPIENVRVGNMDNELSVSGRITNKGRREVGDIELTVYVLDDKENIVLETEHMARSNDGLPLRPGQRRPFTVKISPVPIPATEVLVLVTDIKFTEHSLK